MRTGNYRFVQIGQGRWFRRVQPVQVLMVEVEEPVDVIGTRSRFWQPATTNDMLDYAERERKAATDLAQITAERDRLRERLDDMGKILEKLSSRATEL